MIVNIVKVIDTGDEVADLYNAIHRATIIDDVVRIETIRGTILTIEEALEAVAFIQTSMEF